MLHRSFYGARPASVELCEEFRLFNNLFHDLDRDEYITFAENGDEELIVRMKVDRVEVRRPELMRYVTAKGMVLALYIDRFRYGMIEPVLRDDEAIIEDMAEADMVYNFRRSDARYSGYKDRNVFSRLLGKVLVRGGPEWAFNRKPRKQQHQEFIIGVDESGEPRLHTCDPEALARPFGGNPGAASYLTPVFFRRDVLQKYYADPSRYEVTDSGVRCASLWSLRLDNNHERYVIVWLGDLGTYLPEKERPYWKSFNVRPDGRMSETYLRRAIHGDFAGPSAEDHVFKDQYEDTNRRWQESLGWSLFRPLSKGDEHLALILRVPLSHSPSEFDEQVSSLTKLMVDSLNEAELARGLSASLTKNAKGITKLEAFLNARDVEGVAEIGGFLRGIQSLRSTGIAHLEGQELRRGEEEVRRGRCASP